MGWLGKKEVNVDQVMAKAVFDHSPDAMLLFSGGKFVSANPAAARVYDRPLQAILGHSPATFAAPCQPDGRPTEVHVGERVAQALQEGFARFEWLNTDSRGQIVRMLVTLIPAHVVTPQDMLVLCQEMGETMAIVNQLGDGLSRLANGDLMHRIEKPFRDDYEPLRLHFNEAAQMLGGSIESINASSRRVHSAALEIGKAAGDLSRRTEHQAASLEETAAAMRQVTTAIQETAQFGNKAAQVAASAQQNAAQSGVVVQRAMDAMGGIERTSNEISEIIGVIDGIAFQTNLLALNAGVEAARAGDAGKGFAVVASEVRALAQRSADAAKDVKSRIGASDAQIRSGVQEVDAAGSTLQRIAAQVSEMATLIGDIASASQQQASSASQITIAIGDLDSVTQQNAAMVEEASAAAREMVSEASAMTDQVGRFRLGAQAPAMAQPMWKAA
ncbi:MULTISPECIES: methyl-accepting chemotaxis protein [Sphingomonas]|jgi:methyl-accepting chemotaxis protein|uniref:methyl-accepting chemotaxis protein n=1 Tax=Sphingomonas TaxID=13687 RepID=UPI000975D1CA|nr:methyl-accepting chemotaxis protein [Sphingomonas sp. Sph1(2015)]OMJ30936.1 chemotaxis protein [Sphingomonas sp. Sph1(2015)]